MSKPRRVSRRTVVKAAASLAFGLTLPPQRAAADEWVSASPGARRGWSDIRAYLSSTSVSQGSVLSIHASGPYEPDFAYSKRRTGDIDPGPLLRASLAIYRVGAHGDQSMLTGIQIDAPPRTIFEHHDVSVPHPSDSSYRGCGWPETYSFSVPHSWPSGFYYARLTSFTGAQIALNFVVKSAASPAKILVVLPVATHNAYNRWGGKSMYPGPGSSGGVASPKVSFERPDAFGQGAGSPLYFLHEEEVALVRWAALNETGFAAIGPIDFATSIDLHANTCALEKRRLVVSVGHDEYWSSEMRANVERFIESGGNVAFLSGNTCYWQVQFEPSPITGVANQVMTCFKSQLANGGKTDLFANTHSVNNPEELLTCVASRFGASWSPSLPAPIFPIEQYRVRAPTHWALEGTGLEADSAFGAGLAGGQSIIGYETDGRPRPEDPVPRGQQGYRVPENLTVIAEAFLDWAALSPGNRSGRVTMATRQHTRWAMAGASNRGVVFTVGSIFWCRCLWNWTRNTPEPPNPAAKITENVIKKLGTLA